MPQKPPSQLEQVTFQILRGMILKLVEEMDSSDLEDLFSHDLEDPKLLAKLTSHFDKRHRGTQESQAGSGASAASGA